MSTAVNISRWAAMALGVFYGFSHQTTITARDKAAAAKHDYDRKQQLIDQARNEFRKLHSRDEDDGTTDFSNPSFDLERWLNKVS
ncbi:hypothetical protein K470DRAFT_252479 [Piedraia hortae CBS 480.64]|uniref:ATP synthase F(0) complex subunit e, mitochondrial n=1 Tax=Piedraia hortae CBS 480.64 TaxID=1314780 RepID=A0A6A7BSH2_9PEZI|nr:hypothetical protein K470DRAFT_252479 [Piedraia hortae CBS 480.64]